MNLDTVLFNIGSYEFTVGRLTLSLLVLAGTFVLYQFVARRALNSYFRLEKVKTVRKRRIRNLIRNSILIAGILGLLWATGIDYTLLDRESYDIRVTTILLGILILLAARILDWFISKILIWNYYRSRGENLPEEPVTNLKDKVGLTSNRTLQWVVYVLALLFLLQAFDLNFTIWSYQDGLNSINFKISNILKALLILLIARLLIWVIVQLFLQGYYNRKEINIGSQYAINQLLTYFLYVVAILLAMENLGVKMTIIWGGAAALLVGIGLGLQQTFNDFFSGIILLFERSVEVKDVVEIDGLVGTVKKIGLRTSTINTLDNISVVVPNSKLTSENVINWSHYDDKARFKVVVGVAYGSDTEKVKEALLVSAKEVEYILAFPAPLVRFVAFGDSSLNFELHFWTRRFLAIEDIKSDLHFAIDKAFREEKIQIPFPQRDVWIKGQADPGKASL